MESNWFVVEAKKKGDVGVGVAQLLAHMGKCISYTPPASDTSTEACISMAKAPSI